MAIFTSLFDTSDFPARWNCGRWTTSHGWLHIASDLGIWSAYLAIPLVLLFFVRRRGDLPFRKIFLLFGAFILLCGTTHLMEALIFYWPAYRLAGVIKLVTAVVSWATVFALITVVPKVLTMRSAEALEREVTARKQVEATLQHANALLEERVKLRTLDLTRANAVLHDERDLLRTTLGSIGDGVIATDAQARITFLNPVARAMTGWTGSDAVGQKLEDVFHIVNESTGEPVENPALRALKNGLIVGLGNHTILISKDGTRRPIDDSGAPIRAGDSGIVVGAVLVFRDVSERRLQEDRVRDGRERLAFALEASDIGQWELNLTDRSVSRTLRHDQIFGYRELLPSWTYDIFLNHVVPQDRAEVDRRFQDTAVNGAPYDVECRIQTAEGAVKNIWTKAHIHRDLHGKIERIIGLIGDMTQRRQMEDELRNLASNLAEADRRKDEFLATLAHELRNPLAPISNGLQVLKLSGGGNQASELARSMMERQLNQMVRLVDDLLDVSRITRNRLELRRERIDLSAAVNAAVETSQAAIEAGAHRLTIRLPSEPLWVDADLIRLAQIFSNLLTNAAKYTDSGGEITLQAERHGDDATVTVRDNGMGIPAAMLPRVFEMFTQVDHTLERAQGGLGIGLTLVRRLTEMHGGTVAAHSDGPGMGSEFKITLPLSPTKKTTASVTVPGRPSRRRILVVDDNLDSAKSLRMLLEMQGHEVSTVHDGLAAVEMAEKISPELILLDLGMPKMNGYEACRRIRSNNADPRPVIVACTGWGQAEDRRLSRDAGFDFHLTKPVESNALARILAESLTLRR